MTQDINYSIIRLPYESPYKIGDTIDGRVILEIYGWDDLPVEDAGRLRKLEKLAFEQAATKGFTHFIRVPGGKTKNKFFFLK